MSVNTFYQEIHDNFVKTNVYTLDDKILQLYHKIQSWMQDKIRSESLVRGWERTVQFHFFYTVENPDDFAVWRKPKDLKIGYKFNKSKESFTEIYNVKEFAKVGFTTNFCNCIRTALPGFNINFIKTSSPNISKYKQDDLPIYHIGDLQMTVQF